MRKCRRKSRPRTKDSSFLLQKLIKRMNLVRKSIIKRLRKTLKTRVWIISKVKAQNQLIPNKANKKAIHPRVIRKSSPRKVNPKKITQNNSYTKKSKNQE